MSVGVHIDLQPDSAILPALARLALGGNDKTQLFNEIGISLAENTRLRFSDQAGPDGTAWTPSRRAIAQGGDTLRDTGRLMASITHALLPDGVEVGTNVAYAPTLHFGATITAVSAPYLRFKIPGGGWARKKSVTIPSRQFLGVNDEDEETVLDLISAFLERPQ